MRVGVRHVRCVGVMTVVGDVRMARMRGVRLGVRQGRPLPTDGIGLLHQLLVEPVMPRLRVGQMSMPVVAVAVHQLSYFRIFVADVVAQFRLLEARRRHPLVTGAAGGRVGRVQAGLDERFARLRRDHRLELARRERVHVTGLGRHQEHHLRAGERREFVCLRGGEKEMEID